MKIQESGENYLETILLLHKKHGYARAVDIAAALDFSKPSVSRAMSILREAGLIDTDESGAIILTQSGEARANEIYERHCVITRFLVNTLGISTVLASKDACRIEHVISAETFEKMKELDKKAAAVK